MPAKPKTNQATPAWDGSPTPWETYKAQVEAEAREERNRIVAEAREAAKEAAAEARKEQREAAKEQSA